MIGLFYAAAALPTFLLVRERSRPAPGFEDASLRRLIGVAATELKNTYALVRRFPTLFRFLLAFMVYTAGLEVVIKFIGIYATGELSMTTGELISMFLILQISAAIGALGFGFLETRLGAKRTVGLTIVWWIVGILAMFFIRQLAAIFAAEVVSVFFVIALIAGAGIGSIQSSSRTVVGLLAPPGRSAQVFGFWGMFMRLAVILAMTFGPVADALDSRRLALLLVLAFFVVGGLMLSRVPIDEAIAEGRAAEG